MVLSPISQPEILEEHQILALVQFLPDRDLGSLFDQENHKIPEAVMSHVSYSKARKLRFKFLLNKDPKDDQSCHVKGRNQSY